MDTRNDDDNREILGEREEGFSVRDLADIAQTTVRTIHYYIAEGLLPPPRGSKRLASYSEAHVARLRLIAALRDEGLALAAIRARLAPLTDEQALAVVATLDEHLAAGDRSITLLGLLEAALTREVSQDLYEIQHVDQPDATIERQLGIQEESMHPTNLPGARRAFLGPPTAPAPASAAQPMRAPHDQTPGAAPPDAPTDSASDYLSRLLRRPASKRPGPSRPAPLPRPPQPMPRPQPLPDPYASLRPETWHHFEIADGVELRVRDDRYRQERGQLRAVIDSLRPLLLRYGLTHEPPDDDR